MLRLREGKDRSDERARAQRHWAQAQGEAESEDLRSSSADPGGAPKVAELRPGTELPKATQPEPERVPQLRQARPQRVRRFS